MFFKISRPFLKYHRNFPYTISDAMIDKVVNITEIGNTLKKIHLRQLCQGAIFSSKFLESLTTSHLPSFQHKRILEQELLTVETANDITNLSSFIS